ncbi:MAG TPA: hemerythrin domain-containing protein [Polyangiales bacterium]|nr:hemerythrin domain-containing protein [Polyangiales bacterium]
MEATDMLMQEHRVIEKALDAMEGWSAKLGRATEPDEKAELARFVAFIQGFADAYHHGKEEDILFVLMGQHGFPRHVGPIAVMLQEHDLGRSLVGVLGGLAKQSAPWSKEDRATIAQTVQEFSALLRQHIRKEDQVLYPMADARLPEPIKAEMFRRFQEFEEQRTESGEQKRLRELGEALIQAHAP